MIKLLYPPRCPMCGEISEGICRECEQKVRYVEEPRCFRCGKPLEEEEQEYCLDCSQHSHWFDQGRGLYVYQDPVKESIHKIKYQNKREYLDFYGEELADAFWQEAAQWDPQVLIPIPMHPGKKRSRGYNQAELLADRLGEHLDLPVEKTVLRKIRRTADQKELSHRQRRQNLKKAFAVNEDFLDETGSLPWSRVLLVDDVYTTGSTIDAAAEELKKCGVEKVYFITICVGEGAS